MKLRLFIALLFFAVTIPCVAVSDFYTLNADEQKRFLHLTAQLRCLVCQNQSLAESNTPLAEDLRTTIFLQMQQGKSNDDIIKFLVARYGNFILYQPPFKWSTVLLWLTPFVFFIGALSYLLMKLRQSQKNISR